MRFAGVKEFKQKTMDLLKASREEDIIITAYGKPAAILHGVSEDDLADYLIENDPSFKRKVEEAYAEYLEQGGMAADRLIGKLERRRGSKKV